MTRHLRACGLAATCLISSFAAAGSAAAADLRPVPASAPATIPIIVPPSTPAIPPLAIAPATPATIAARPAASTPSLHDLVLAYVDYGNQDEDGLCLAGAVYFEARGEELEGQLAVAQVILNRAASGVFPTSLCEVVKQPAQFSFVSHGRFPAIDKNSDCWHRALAIADIARQRRLGGEVAANVLWYHATYVSPSWDREKTRTAQIGNHVFFS